MSELNEKQGVSESDLRMDRLASVGQIAAGIAHEVRNPLTAVKGFLQLLKEESNHKYLDYAFSELDNAINTLQNLLNVSKPDLENEPYDVIDLCSELESLLYLFQERSYHISIRREFSNTDARVYGKRNQLKKALFNLLKNAFEAITERGTITIKHYRSQGNIIIAIADTGCGIPKDKVELLGTPFYTSKVEGTGMGLSQVFSTIYDHNGIVRVKSEIGVGTQFTILLPIYHAENESGVMEMIVKYEPNQSFSQFYTENQAAFIQSLKRQGEKIFDLMESSQIAAEFIIESANQVVHLLNDRNEQGLILHAKEHGRNWARQSLDLMLKLEWIQILRKTYWEFLFHYYNNVEQEQQVFFELERQVNFTLDSYLKHFASSYTEYKNELLYSQREVIEKLIAPVITLGDHTALLPLVGVLDDYQARKNQEHVLLRIYELKLKRLIIDLSGIIAAGELLITHLNNIVQGAALQGCKVSVAGIRPETTKTIIETGIALHENAEIWGTTQQAVEQYIINDQ